MLCGGAEGASEYIWAGFDAMRVLTRASNDEPTRASRPMSASAAGFVPAAGAGVLVLESLESALERGAHIHCELAGGSVNCGGQRAGGSMTAPNPQGVRRCVDAALVDSRVGPAEVDAISGHLTATAADPREIAAWAQALGRAPAEFPPITATKSLIGHALGAAGAIESVAAVLMLTGGFVHPSINCDDVHPDIAPYSGSIAHERVEPERFDVLVKAAFGFGDVNAAVVFRRTDATW
jgi:3-oxoacyl-(acyl-carrier-protein) synthase